MKANVHEIPSLILPKHRLKRDTSVVRADGRYRSTLLVKEAGGQRVLFGRDTTTGDPVVIRQVPQQALSEGARLRLEHSIRVLDELHCDLFALPLWVGSDTDSTVVVTKYLPGKTLAEQLLREGKLSVEASLNIAKSILTALRELHAHEVLHQDVKPSNIVLDGDEPAFRASLIDFGFAKSAALDQSLRGLHVGTALYMSPEQAGLLNAPIDERSDLYSLGIVLYEALAGRCPYSGQDVGEILRAHLCANAAPLSAVRSDVPQALMGLLARLMEKDPRERYQTAAGVLADLEMLIRARAQGTSDPFLVLGRFDRHTGVTEPLFVGRRNELEDLRSAWLDAAAGIPGICLLEGDSGSGKTRLLEELVTAAAKLGAKNVFWGRGIDQAVQRPFQVLVGVAEEAARVGAVSPEFRKRIRERVGDMAEAAGGALPELKQLFLQGAMLPDTWPENFGEIRTFAALGAWLDALGSAETPALVILDDCQWSDESTLRLLQHWQRGTKRTESHVMIVAAFRTEEVPAGHPLRKMESRRHLVLFPLEEKETREVVESMAGTIPDPIHEIIASVAGGSPFMISAVVRGLVESGAITSSKDGWKIDSTKLATLQSSRKAASFLIRRMELLSPATLDFLTGGAVIGKQFDIRLAAPLIEQTPAQALEAIAEASRCHILWMRDANVASFAHDKLREALLKRLSEQQTRSLHLQFAETLERCRATEVFELAFHFDAAECPHRALPYALAGAAKARAQHSLEVAERLYRIAQRAVTETDHAQRLAIAEGLGDILMLRGQYDLSEESLSHAAFLATLRIDRARIEGKRGEVLFKRGNITAAAKALETAAAILGRTVPKSDFVMGLFAAWEVFIQVLHTLLPRFFVSRRKRGAQTEEEFVVIRLLSRLAYIYWFKRGRTACGWAHIKEMNLAERYPASLELAQAYSEHAPVMTMVPYYSRGMRYAERSLEIRRAFNDIWGQGQSLHFYGVVLYSASRFEECIQKCTEAVRLLERAGDRWEVNTANWHIAFSHYRLGNLHFAAELGKQVHQCGLEIGDFQASGIGLSAWAKATNGKIPAALVSAEINRRTGDAHTHVEVLLAEGIRLLSQSHTKEAATQFRKARRIVKESGLQQEYVAPVLPWLLTALRSEVEKRRQRLTPGETADLLSQARIVGKSALAEAKKYRNNLPHTYRELALLAAMAGKIARARRFFSAAIITANAQGMKAELMSTFLARARVGEELGWASVTIDKESADALRKTIDPAQIDSAKARTDETAGSVSILDRFVTMMEAGKLITGSLTRPQIMAATHDAALKLLRGEACLVLEGASQGGKIVYPHGSLQSTYSKTVVERVLTTGELVTLTDGTSAEASDSIVLQGIRSAICVPFRVRDRIEGCFYLTHRRVGTLFDKEEVRLAEFIAALTGAALENADGFDRLKRINEDFQQELRRRELAERALKKQTVQLEKSNADLERFAYVASHDLKEPLRTVLNNVRLLEKHCGDTLDGDAKEFMRFAVDGANWMYGLIDALLTYSRINASPDQRRGTNLNLTIKEVLSGLSQAIEESGAKIECSELPSLFVNEMEIAQLFQNLIGNAIKFRRSEAPMIRISAVPQDGEWLFEVRDNGIGIDKKYYQRIFEIFQRLHDRQSYPGTGIGLSVCKRIVELYGGRIWLDSSPGVGSDFHFTVPDDRLARDERPNRGET